MEPNLSDAQPAQLPSVLDIPWQFNKMKNKSSLSDFYSWNKESFKYGISIF